MEIVNETQLKEILAGNKGTVVVDFFATWCGPCKMFGPVLEQVAKEREDITFVKLDIDNDTNYAISMKVMAVPTMIVFKDGVEATRTQGFMSKAEVLEAIG